MSAQPGHSQASHRQPRHEDEIAWQARALCKGAPPDLFFPEVGKKQYRESATALYACARCDVRLECLHYALEHNEQYGVWGGTTERQRAALQRKLRLDGGAAG